MCCEPEEGDDGGVIQQQLCSLLSGAQKKKTALPFWEKCSQSLVRFLIKFFFFFPFRSDTLVAGFEIPLELQIDSSGFLCFSYLSFSIRQEGRNSEAALPAWTLKNASVEQIIHVIFIYSYCFRRCGVYNPYSCSRLPCSQWQRPLS